MKSFIKFLFIILVCCGCISSCDDYKQYEEEMYKKQIYIVSKKDMIFNVECDMNVEKGLYNLSIACGGSKKLDTDVTVTIEGDTLLLPRYNYLNFELDTSKYAWKLDESKYNFNSLTTVIRARSEYGLVPFSIISSDLYDLCPDSTYFIPMAIKSVSEYELNKKKFNVLLRILPKNTYAETAEATYYLMKGKYSKYPLEENKEINSILFPSKIAHPISANEVRFFIGNENRTKRAEINKYGIVIKVNEDKSLDLRPYRPDSALLEIEKLDPPIGKEDFIYTNKYVETPDRYVPNKYEQRFLIYLKYRTRNKISDNWGDWIYTGEAINREYYEDKFE